ncbi:hypothetical protein UACE39S_05731 [Ureibacillus acetophenoni]
MIKVENLHQTFGKLEVLKVINREIAEQEVVCVIGPSASGDIFKMYQFTLKRLQMVLYILAVHR